MLWELFGYTNLVIIKEYLKFIDDITLNERVDRVCQGLKNKENYILIFVVL